MEQLSTTIKLIDSTFSHNPSIGLAGENTGDTCGILWDTDPGPAHLKVFTDLRLAEVMESDAEVNIGLIVESPLVAKAAHELARKYKDHFNLIFTHDRELIELGPPFAFYPLGGSWIRKWADFTKSDLVSILASDKYTTLGHLTRHDIVERFRDQIDVYGEPYSHYLPTKKPALRNYWYSIIVENGRKDYYFSEKLIDCLSQATIPIYWGCPSIGSFFEPEGILSFSTLDELSDILSVISPEHYMRHHSVVQENLRLARNFRCPEAWILRILTNRGYL